MDKNLSLKKHNFPTIEPSGLVMIILKVVAEIIGFLNWGSEKNIQPINEGSKNTIVQNPFKLLFQNEPLLVFWGEVFFIFLKATYKTKIATQFTFYFI